VKRRRRSWCPCTMGNDAVLARARGRAAKSAGRS
jgi:hypothetical protein